ncbi:MAG: ABC transporter substrate-binding protein [Oscillospiraceae bacterium]|nr:ABC transporter substrate-binding protein [Oscillospiraceae bacterium]
MKKVIFTVITFCLLVALFITFGSQGGWDKIRAFGEITKNKNVIHIGVYEPATGDYAQGGMTETLGIRYANLVCPTVDIGGITYEIELTDADSALDEIGSAPSAEALISADVAAVLGSYASKPTAAGLAEFEKYGIPMVGISCSSQYATEASSDYFRLCGSDAFQSGVMANLAYGMELRKAAVLTQTGDEYSKKAGKIFAEAFKKLGGETIEYSFQLGQQNFRALSADIAAGGADFVFMISGASEANYFINQSRDEGLLCPILGPETWDSPLLLNDVTYNSRSVYVASEFDSSSSADPVSLEFTGRYSVWLEKDLQRINQNGGNNYTSTAAAMAYDGYMLIVSAIKAADSKDPQAIKAALYELEYSGLTGTISFGDKGESLKKQILIKTINTGSKQFEVLQKSTVGK